MAKKSILIIEDNDDARMLLARVVKMEGFPVLEARDGADALTKLSPEVAMILMDLSMPRMSGEEFMEQLRKDGRFSDIKVVVVSGWDDVAQRAKAMGAHSYLRKPVRLEDLTKILNF